MVDVESEESWETLLWLKWLTCLYLKLNTPVFTRRTPQTTACDQSEGCHRKATFLGDKRPQPQKRMSHNNENVTLAQGIEAKHRQPVCWLEEGIQREPREGQWRGGNGGCRSTLPPTPPALSTDWKSDKYAWVWFRQWRPLMVWLRVLYLRSK